MTQELRATSSPQRTNGRCGIRGANRANMSIPHTHLHHLHRDHQPRLDRDTFCLHKMLPTLIRRAAKEGPYKSFLNPYKAKKTWPPDFSQLSQKHQFQLERRYRRRAKLAWARPRWTKLVKLVTWTTITCELPPGFNGMRQKRILMLKCSRRSVRCLIYGDPRS